MTLPGTCLPNPPEPCRDPEPWVREGSEDQSRRRRQGIGFMLLGCGLLTLNDATAKWLTTTYPVGEIIFFRGAVAVMLIVGFGLRNGGAAALRPRSLGGQIYRALLFVVSTLLFTLSVKLMPLPVVTAITFASPVLLTALAPVILKERVGWHRWMAVAVGFCGVLLIVNPAGADASWMMLLPLACALVAAFRDITTRQLALTESTRSILFVTALVSTGVGLCPLPLGGWVWPSWPDVAMFAFLGLSQVSAHALQVHAFRIAEATLLAPFKYSSLIWSLTLGFLIWDYVPSLWTLLGSASITMSGIFIFHREVNGRAFRKG